MVSQRRLRSGIVRRSARSRAFCPGAERQLRRSACSNRQDFIILNATTSRQFEQTAPLLRRPIWRPPSIERRCVRSPSRELGRKAANEEAS